MQLQRFTKTVYGVRLLVLLVAAAVATCQPSANPPSSETASAVVSTPDNCRTVEHMMGATEICGQPQRVIVLGPYFLEPLLTLEVQPIAYGDHADFHLGDYTNPSQQIPYLGNYVTQPIANVGSAQTPSIEALLKLQPDLIIGGNANEGAYETLSQIAPTLLLADRNDAEQNLQTIAQGVDRVEQAEQVLAQTQQQIAAAKESFASLVATHPQVALLMSSDLSRMGLASPVGPCATRLKALGFELFIPPGMTENNPGFDGSISLETLPEFNDADTVILLGFNFSEVKQPDGAEQFEDHQLSNLKQAWEKNAIAQSLDASKADRVYFIPAYVCRGLPGAIGTELYLEELQEQLLLAQ